MAKKRTNPDDTDTRSAFEQTIGYHLGKLNEANADVAKLVFRAADDRPLAAAVFVLGDSVPAVLDAVGAVEAALVGEPPPLVGMPDVRVKRAEQLVQLRQIEDIATTVGNKPATAQSIAALRALDAAIKLIRELLR